MFYSSDLQSNGDYSNVVQLKELFSKIGIDTKNIKTKSIQILEKRFKNYQGFMQLLEKGDPEDNLRISNLLDSY